MATPTVYVICDQNCKFESMTKEQILAAIAQAVNEGTIGDVDTGFVQTIKTINNKPLRFFVGSQAEYDDLADEDKANLFAIITNDTTKEGILSAINTLEDDLYTVGNQVSGIISGSIPAKRATNADCDDQGNNISQTYSRLATSFARVQGLINKTINSIGFEGKVRLGNIPNGKTIYDIVAISFATQGSGEEKHHFQGMRTTPMEEDANGKFVEFACVRSGAMGSAEDNYRYVSATVFVRVYEVDGVAYLTYEGGDGMAMVRTENNTWEVTNATNIIGLVLYKTIRYAHMIYS